MEYQYLISDVDGILTDGGHYYTEKGKFIKKFGSNDKDALKILNKKYVEKIVFITADKKGYKISKKRIEEMGFELVLLDVFEERKKYMESLEGKIVYIADGIHDSDLFPFATLSFCLQDSTPQAKKNANVVLETTSAKNAFCYLLEYLENKKEKEEIKEESIIEEADKKSVEDLKNLYDSFGRTLSISEEISDFCKSVAEAYTGKNKVVFCGVGKNASLSEMVCEFLHPYNIVSITLDPHRAVHGNLGILEKEDILIFSTKSGNTSELIYLLECLERKMKIENMFLIVSNEKSELERRFKFKRILKVPVEKEIAQFSHSPQTTIFLYAGIMMVLINRIAEKKQLSERDYLLNHQAGEIGKNFVK